MLMWPSFRIHRRVPPPSSKIWQFLACPTPNSKSTTGAPTLTPAGSHTTTRSCCRGRTSWWPRTLNSAATATISTSASLLAERCLRTSCQQVEQSKLTWARSEVRFTAPTKAWRADCRLAWTSKAETQPAPRSPTTRWILPTLTTPSWTTSTSTPSRALTPTPVWHKRC